jgi:hypothetical protein
LHHLTLRYKRYAGSLTLRHKQYAESLILRYKRHGEYQLSALNDTESFRWKNLNSNSLLYTIRRVAILHSKLYGEYLTLRYKRWRRVNIQ